MIDPAHDFGKNTFHSLEVTRRLGEMVDTGYPVLVSLSNKDFVGETLDLPVGERLDRHPRRDRRLRARRRPDLPRARGRRDPADRRHGRRRSPAGARRGGRSGGCSDARRAGAGRARAAAGVRRPRGPGRRAAGRLPGGRGLAGPGPVAVLADPQGARVAAYSARGCGGFETGASAPSSTTGAAAAYLVVGNGSRLPRPRRRPAHLDERAGGRTTTRARGRGAARVGRTASRDGSISSSAEPARVSSTAIARLPEVLPAGTRRRSTTTTTRSACSTG